MPPPPVDGAGEEAIRRSLRTGSPVVIDESRDLGARRPGLHSLLVVPLHFESRVSGAICLIAHGTRRFTDADVRLMRILSDQAAVAIENTRLLQGRDELAHEFAGLLEISDAAAGADDEATLAALLGARLREQTRTDGVLIARSDDGSTLMRVIHRDGVAGDSGMVDVAESAVRRRVLRTGHPIVLQSSDADEGFEPRTIGVHTLVLLPLNAGGRTFGIVELWARSAPYQPTAAEMQACEAMASLAAAGLEKVRVLTQLRNAADLDLVTEVHNHRYLQERLRQELARSARSRLPLAVLMLDVDKFKPINDRHGHADGDRVLRNIAATIKAHVRTSDVVARYGGDEFVVLIPGASDDAAELVASRIVTGVLTQRHSVSDGHQVSVGISAGLAVYPDDGRTSAQLLQAADAAMYAAKRRGGRKVQRSQMPVMLEIGEAVRARASA